MKKIEFISGEVYGSIMLTGKGYSTFVSDRKRRFLECLCECGKIIYVASDSIRRGLTKSCGCQNQGNTTHGLSYHPLYTNWMAMKMRCFNTEVINYMDYGGRGITVCDEWKDNFKAFYDWCIAKGWKKGLTVDRFQNNDGNYEPSNCRLATRRDQDRNKRNSHLVTAFGETKNICDWAIDSRCDVSVSSLNNRLKTMSPEEAILSNRKSSNQYARHTNHRES